MPNMCRRTKLAIVRSGPCRCFVGGKEVKKSALFSTSESERFVGACIRGHVGLFVFKSVSGTRSIEARGGDPQLRPSAIFSLSPTTFEASKMAGSFIGHFILFIWVVQWLNRNFCLYEIAVQV